MVDVTPWANNRRPQGSYLRAPCHHRPFVPQRPQPWLLGHSWHARGRQLRILYQRWLTNTSLPTSCPVVILQVQKEANKKFLTAFWKADPEWKISTRNNWNSLLGINSGFFPQSFCSSPPLIQTKNCLKTVYIYIHTHIHTFFLWEQTLPLHPQTMCPFRTTPHWTLSSRHKKTWQAASQSSFTKTIQFPSNHYQLNSGSHNISDNTGGKHFVRFSGHPVSNLQIKTSQQPKLG